MRKLLLEALVSITFVVLLFATAVWLRAADLAMLAILAPIPLFLLLAIRRHLSLARKLSYAGPVPFVLPVVLLFFLTDQFPGRTVYFLVGITCVAIFIVSFLACIRVIWEVR